MPFGARGGPSVWCHSALPDYHAFSGRGGYAFPLYDRRGGPTNTNLNPVLLTALAEAYGEAQAPQAVFDAILGLLSAASYTAALPKILRTLSPTSPSPPIPPSSLRLQPSARASANWKPLPRMSIRVQGQELLPPHQRTHRPGRHHQLCRWRSSALRRWLGPHDRPARSRVELHRQRLPRPASLDRGAARPARRRCVEEFRDIAARIHELIQRFSEADLVLSAVLADTLTREELGFPAPTTEADGQSDE